MPSDEGAGFHPELVATELLTNAVRHAYGPLTVGVALEGGLVVIEVVAAPKCLGRGPRIPMTKADADSR
ncbi:hypothetical protein ABZ864_09595 [Streptomyces sp. NPDC047082]|uniref:hypothetical protein n=1 Tax=Streptomyces sp. NPDC047082 TaxID=3155259 RepID=UPI0033D091BC